ncbi:MAG: glycosyl hydrolase [Cyclobacteriaceae bacterium]
MQKLKILIFAALVTFSADAQRRNSNSSDNQKTQLEKTSLNGLKFRNLGPALTSGRIADFAVNPENTKEYFVATASGGVWKTTNAGVTYTPVFDGQGSYSIGCVTLDPNNPNVVWVGTGENNNQRVVGYGDGVYKSIDGGKTWKNMGLKSSEHIGGIIVQPDNSDVIYVAAYGPLWNKGGERGVYKSTDGGESWTNILSVDEHTGINEIHMDPRNPKVLYAAAHQRRRHVFTYIGGGPGSGLHKTTDGGQTWTEINQGLPKVDLGRIGLAISANPDILYAIVEAAQDEDGFYRSTNRGASWEKRSGFATSGNYYQELFADPLNPDKVYAMNNWQRVSSDGGKTFQYAGEDFKHIDNHVLWIDPSDTDHQLSGNDGGIAETWDAGATWDFKANLPVTQFYKVTVDNASPFYNIAGGTQDNFSLLGPSRTLTGHGITNFDWIITRGGDGFETQIDPFNENIVYAQSQYGVLFRFDKKSGEEVGIQPQERKDEDSYIFNWDAPLHASSHKEGRIYFAGNKLFKSDDRGDSWEVISEDLTQQVDRNKLKVMDRIWGIDAVAKNQSTSPYGAAVSFAESPLNENLLYVGTDDGLVQITENGGESWTKISSFSGVPGNTYVNALFASNHDENVVYACFNNHKWGDFKPYVYRSSDKGRTWTAINGNLPDKGTSYSIAEDHVDPNLLFVGTEFGVFFSNNGGSEWKQLKAGMPTVGIKDIALQQRESDLVLASFGRGFFVLDDYSSLRTLNNSTLNKEAELFSVRDALMWNESLPLGLPGKSFQGDNFYTAENLGPVAMFTYYLKDDIKTKVEIRREAEKERKEAGSDNSYPSYDNLLTERNEKDPYLLFTVKDTQGNVVRKLTEKAKKGVSRIQWDLRYAAKDPIDFSTPPFYNPFGGSSEGRLVEPGQYSVSLAKSVDGIITELAGPVSFNVKTIDNRSLPAENRAALADFQSKVGELIRSVSTSMQTLREMDNQIRHIKEAIKNTEVDHATMMSSVNAITDEMAAIRLKLSGDPVAGTLDIDVPPTITGRMGWLGYAISNSTSKPLEHHKASYQIAVDEYKPLLTRIQKLINEDFKQLTDDLVEAGAPYTPYAHPDLR